MAVSPITPWTVGGISTSDNAGGHGHMAATHQTGYRSISTNIFSRRLYELERACNKLKDSLHPNVRRLLPGPSEVLQYPLHVITTRSSLSGLIPRVPQTKDGTPNSYVELNLNANSRFESAKGSSQLPPGRRWLKFSSPAFIKIAEQATTKPGRVSIARIPEDIKALSTCGAIKHLYRVYGFGGFYKGFVSSHNTNLINEGLVSALTPPTQKLIQTIITKPQSERIHSLQRETFWQRFLQWYQSEQGVIMSATFGASLLASTITYPLSTINLRRIVYEPLDGIDVNFVDMARLTVLFDGSPSLFNGYGSYISAKLIQAVGTLCAQATASSLEAKANSNPASIALLNQVKPALDVLTSPLTQYAQQSQALSRIPGLAYSKPSFRSALGNLLSPAAVIEIGANLVIVLATYYSIVQASDMSD